MESGIEVAWKNSFFQENFNVDQCLSKYTVKSDLEALRNDLKSYGNELHQQMAEILKTETEAIVNLAEYLTNLNSKIEDLSLPISQLREEIKTLYDLIKQAEDKYSNTLDNIKTKSNQRSYLNLKSAILTSASYIDDLLTTRKDNLLEDSIVLERVVNKYSFEYNYLQAFAPESDLHEISSVGKKLTEIVNKIFLNGVNNDDQEVILRSLRMYDNLGAHKEAEKTYQLQVVRPVLAKLFTQRFLEASNQDIGRIYEEALAFVSSKLSAILRILESCVELKSYNFVLHSFWPEVDKQSRDGLPYITAPGNPELFQKRFKTTWNFLTTIARMCGDENLIHTNDSFQSHIKRFNLPVYFEIRFQQIAGKFEADAILKAGPGIYLKTPNDLNCELKLTLTLWESLKLCFSSDVFIDNLADQFLKLSMLLLSRYLRWFENALEESDQFTEGSEAWEDFISNSLNDLNMINQRIGFKSENAEISDTVYKIMPVRTSTVLISVLKLNTQTINSVKTKLQDHLISIKTRESLAHLQNVASIPRLYRRTNRSVPKENSNYVIEAVQPIVKLHRKFKSSPNKNLEGILNVVITNVTNQYLSLVEDVLRSVCKTEESLRRLKNRSTNFQETVAEDSDAPDTMTDEMKIRQQIKLDVTYFINQLHPLALDEARTAMAELKKSQTS